MCIRDRVCTFNVTIPDIVCYALEKGYAVFSEKPPGRNLKDALRMQEAYDKAKAPILKFGFNHRYHNSVIEARALVDSKILGDVVCARGVYGKAGSPNFEGEWRNDTSISGGGIMLDQGIHMLDLMYYFMGEFTEIQSSVDQLVWKDMPTEDSASVSYTHLESQKCAYVYWSRLAAVKMTAGHFKYDYFRRFLTHKVNQGYTLEQVFSSMELEDMLPSFCRDRKEVAQARLTEKNAEEVKEFLLQNFDRVLGHYKEQVEAGEQYFSEILKGCRKAAAVDVYKRQYERMPEVPISEDFLKYSPYIHPSVMFCKKELQQNGYRVSKLTRRCEDYELFMRLHSQGFKGYNLQENLFLYREEKESYKKRKIRFRVYEMMIRYQGFKSCLLSTSRCV